MSHGGVPTTAWIGLYAALGGGAGGLVLALLWTPLLISERVRPLFQFGPTQWQSVNYALGFVALSGLHAGLLGAWIESGSGISSALTAVISLGLIVPSMAVVTVIWVLPELGYDWDPNGYDLHTKAVLAIGAFWYAVMTIVPGFIVSIIAALPS